MGYTICLRCKSSKLYQIRRGKLRIGEDQWLKIIEYFLLERSGWFIAEEMKLSKDTIYKALRLIREKLIKDVPQIFTGIVEVRVKIGSIIICSDICRVLIYVEHIQDWQPEVIFIGMLNIEKMNMSEANIISMA